MDSKEFRAIRRELGLSLPELAVALGLKHDKSASTLAKIEGGAGISGPMALAMTHLLKEHRSKAGGK